MAPATERSCGTNDGNRKKREIEEKGRFVCAILAGENKEREI
jgi:hypothetical protein